MKQARDLFLLSALAYRQGKHQDSATLFAAAMASDDVDQFLEVLNEENTVTSMSLSSTSKSIETSLEQAIANFSEGLASSDEDEDTVEFAESTPGADDEDFDDFGTDEPSSGMLGQPMLPSVLSSGLLDDSEDEPNVQLDEDDEETNPTLDTLDHPVVASAKPKVKVILSSNLNSPVRVKQ